MFQLGRREDPLKIMLAMPGNHLLDTGNFNQVNTRCELHLWPRHGYCQLFRIDIFPGGGQDILCRDFIDQV